MIALKGSSQEHSFFFSFLSFFFLAKCHVEYRSDCVALAGVVELVLHLTIAKEDKKGWGKKPRAVCSYRLCGVSLSPVSPRAARSYVLVCAARLKDAAAAREYSPVLDDDLHRAALSGRPDTLRWRACVAGPVSAVRRQLRALPLEFFVEETCLLF